MNREQYTRLEQIPNIGPSLAEDLRLIGLSHPRNLIGRNPYDMYEELCRKTGQRHDPCVIDVLIPPSDSWKVSPNGPGGLVYRSASRGLTMGMPPIQQSAPGKATRRMPLSLTAGRDKK